MLPAPQSPRKWKIGVKGPKLILFYSYGCGHGRRSFSDVPGQKKRAFTRNALLLRESHAVYRVSFL